VQRLFNLKAESLEGKEKRKRDVGIWNLDKALNCFKMLFSELGTLNFTKYFGLLSL
jgi:hypothetical protein